MRISDMMDMEDSPEEGAAPAATGAPDIAKIGVALDALQAQISALRAMLPGSSETEESEPEESPEEEAVEEEAPGDPSKEMKKSMAAATLSKHL